MSDVSIARLIKPEKVGHVEQGIWLLIIQLSVLQPELFARESETSLRVDLHGLGGNQCGNGYFGGIRIKQLERRYLNQALF
jgi:hypothetical protein